MKLIDVSKHNGVIAWKKVAAAGIDGAIIRVGYGKSAGQIDPKFIVNYREARAAGLKVGVYWYSYAVTAAEARAEASACLTVLNGRAVDFPVYFDMEEKTHTKMNVTKCDEIATAFCEVIERAGYWAGIYSFDSFYASNWSQDMPKRFAAWVARVPSNDNGTNKVDPKCCKTYGIHQYSWKGKINGISGDVDLNNCIIDYPTLINKNGGVDITATIKGITAAKAAEIRKACEALGMTVV